MRADLHRLLCMHLIRGPQRARLSWHTFSKGAPNNLLRSTSRREPAGPRCARTPRAAHTHTHTHTHRHMETQTHITYTYTHARARAHTHTHTQHPASRSALSPAKGKTPGPNWDRAWRRAALGWRRAVVPGPRSSLSIVCRRYLEGKGYRT